MSSFLYGLHMEKIPKIQPNTQATGNKSRLGCQTASAKILHEIKNKLRGDAGGGGG